MIQNNTFRHQANYAYSQYSVVDEMATRHRVQYNPHAIAGMPTDTFRQSTVLTSSRYYTPPSKTNVFLKQVGNLFSGLASALGIVGFFVPPVAAVATVASPLSTMVKSATDGLNTTPTAIQSQTVGRYNYWFR